MKIIKFWKPILIALIILYGSLTSSDHLKPVTFFALDHIDKFIHFLLYATLSLFFYASIKKQTNFRSDAVVVINLITIISYGLLMEVFQYAFTSDRTAEIFDAIANSLGCVFGIFLFAVFDKLNISKYL